jgi:hypothetical protein
MKTLKVFSVLILCSINFQCIHYFSKDTTEFSPMHDETKLLQSKKFGLVEFSALD